MKCYTSTSSGLIPGILVFYNEQPAVLRLGEEGRRRVLVKVPLSEEGPHSIAIGNYQGRQIQRVTQASLQGQEGAWVLAAPVPDARMLVRVKTAAVPVRHTHGSWEVLEGEPILLARGKGAHGGLAQFGTWTDDLVLMHAGDSIRVQPEGAPQIQPYTLTHTGERLEQSA